MRKSNKTEQQVATSPLDVSGLTSNAIKSKSGGSHKRAAEVSEALVDNQKHLNGLQLSLWASNNDVDVDGVEVLRKGINLRPGARRLFGFLQKKIGKEHLIDGEGKASMPLPAIGDAIETRKPVRISGYSYDPPWVSFTAYEAIKEAIGDRHPSKKDYEDFERNFRELQDRWHIFTMRVGTADNRRTVQAKSRIIIDVITESSDTDHGKRYAVSLHPITTSQLGNWFRIYPDDFENQIASRGGNKSPYIYDLADLVLYERDMPNTKRDKHFERTEATLVKHLRLEKYALRRKAELREMLQTAFDQLKGWLIEKVAVLPDKTGSVKYRIYPVFDPVKEIENGAA